MNHVFYHSKCYDGFGAAYAAWKKFGDKAEYHAVSYGYPPPGVKGETLYIVDFSYPMDVLNNLHESFENNNFKKRFEKVVIIDHHKTAQESLEENKDAYPWLEIYFDMEKSGALMTWEYFHPKIPAPMLIRWISDRDLWQFKLPDSEKVHKALVSFPMDFKLWDKFAKGEYDLSTEGITCERLYSQLVDQITKSHWLKMIDGRKVPVVNTSIAWSEVGAKLLELNPKTPFAASFTVFDDQVMWSLRSRSNEDVDVSAIAKKFGGGGHKHAAGFKAQRF